jgi:hypothetical protein
MIDWVIEYQVLYKQHDFQSRCPPVLFLASSLLFAGRWLINKGDMVMEIGWLA